MNQHSRRGGQANGNSVDQMRRATIRPAVVAIVLCVGFAVAMVAIWPFRKPPSHQEMQTQPKAAVQTEIPKPEPVQTEIPEPETVSDASDRDEWLEPPTATPVSQATPAVRQLMDDHVNSPAPVEENQSYTFSDDVNEETTTFEAINPTSRVKGLMTVTITGAFRGNRLGDDQSSVDSHLQANQQATFSFVPYYSNSPSYSAKLTLFQVAGDTHDGSVVSDFTVTTKGSDGSSQQFMLRETVTITEDGAQIAFEQRLPDALNTRH